MQNEELRCGYVGIVGRPNVGKSTLLNSILNEKICITSRKAQTTRHKILGIKTHEQCQTIYVDTPGMHKKSSHQINKIMNRTAESVLTDVDIILFVIDARKFTEEDELVLEKVKKVSCPVLLVINKVDFLKDKTVLFARCEALSKKMDFAEIVPISALKHDNVARLEKVIEAKLPLSPHFFPEGQHTDRTRAFTIAEIIREKILDLCSDEVPYSSTVTIESMAEENEIFHIHAILWVERESQKGIVIGKGGTHLRSIGQSARLELEKTFGKKIFLKLLVKVKQGWIDDKNALRQLGVDEIDI
jgi:GTP-binding protein Era